MRARGKNRQREKESLARRERSGERTETGRREAQEALGGRGGIGRGTREERGGRKAQFGAIGDKGLGLGLEGSKALEGAGGLVSAV